MPAPVRRHRGAYPHLSCSMAAQKNCSSFAPSWRTVISEPRLGVLNGRKSFQPRVDSHIQIDFTISCIADGRRADNGATAFVSAIQERYTLKRSSSSASVGVGPVGNISLPFGGTDEAMIKVASETIASPAFYERFFALVEHYLVYLDDELTPAPPIGEAGLTPLPETRPTDPREEGPQPDEQAPGQPKP